MNEPTLRAKDDAFAAAKRVLAHRDPMVHRGIGDAVKEPQVEHRGVVLVRGDVVWGNVLAEAKKKARSDRMKATWAKQREKC